MSESQRSLVRNPPAVDVRIGCPAQIDPDRVSTGVDLFSPLTIEATTFRNRVVLSPMCQYCAEEGLADDWHLVHLGARAAGGAGLVFVEATAVTRDGRITPGDLGIWGDQHVEPLARIARFVESQGAVPGIQLAHAGRKASCAPPWTGGARLRSAAEGAWDAVAPSPVPFRPDDPKPIALDHRGIDAIVDAFVLAARRALAAGFRIIEIHMAHGYLLHEFLSPLSNRRDDEFGGSFENRIKVPIRVAQAVKAELPASSPLFVRISATDWVEGGWDLAQSVEFGHACCKAGVKLIDVSSGALVPDAKIPAARGFQVPFAATIRRETGVGTGAVGMITDVALADEVVTSGAADLVFIGREMLRDPNWPIHAARSLGKDAPWPIPYGYAVEPKKH